MGTALTEQQVRELGRLAGTGTLYLAFDADAAGQEAAVRGMQLAQATGMQVRVVELPEGRDPADVAIADPDAFRAALEAAGGVLAFRIGRILTAPGSRDQRYQRAAAVLREAPASVERAEQVRLVADRLAAHGGPRGGPHAPRRGGERTGSARSTGACPKRPGSGMSACFWPCAWPCRSAVGFYSATSTWHTSPMRRTGRPRRTSAACWRVRTVRTHPHGGHR